MLRLSADLHLLRENTMAVKKTTTRRKATSSTAAKKSTAARRKPAASRKTASRRTAVRKTTARKSPARRKAAAAKPAFPTTAIRKRLTKAQIVSSVADASDLNRRQVAMAFDALENVIERSVKRGSAGEFLLPGLLKVISVKVPARKARPGVNPFTGEKIMIKARPASHSVRVRPLKKLKGFAS